MRTREINAMVAALFVQVPGIYTELGADCWGVERDARKYNGPHPVVAHPPCQRWGRYWSGGPSAKVRRKLGDDGGCFASALESVRTFGGVLEHPEASHAWDHFGIARPPWHGGWVAGDEHGWTCCVAQGWYGHRARKMTWLYAVAPIDALPEFRWGPTPPGSRQRLDEGYHSADERGERHRRPRRRLTSIENAATPRLFAEILMGIARGCRRAAEQMEMFA